MAPRQQRKPSLTLQILQKRCTISGFSTLPISANSRIENQKISKDGLENEAKMVILVETEPIQAPICSKLGLKIVPSQLWLQRPLMQQDCFTTAVSSGFPTKTLQKLRRSRVLAELLAAQSRVKAANHDGKRRKLVVLISNIPR